MMVGCGELVLRKLFRSAPVRADQCPSWSGDSCSRVMDSMGAHLIRTMQLGDKQLTPMALRFTFGLASTVGTHPINYR